MCQWLGVGVDGGVFPTNAKRQCIGRVNGTWFCGRQWRAGQVQLTQSFAKTAGMSFAKTVGMS